MYLNAFADDEVQEIQRNDNSSCSDADSSDSLNPQRVQWKENYEQNYKKGELIGEGTYSNVFRYYGNDDFVAVKELSLKTMTKNDRKLFGSKLKLAKKIKLSDFLVPHLIKITDTECKVYMRELVEFESLYNLIHEYSKRFTEDEIQAIIQKVVKALNQLHEKGFTHGHLTL
jgi:serine/threonine protein kinase